MTRTHLSSCAYLSKNVSYLPDKAADHPYKPNGLWYAFGDSWRIWCVENKAQELAAMYTNRYEVYKYSYRLRVDLGHICVMDDVDSVMEFHWRYGCRYEGNTKAIDWEKVKADYSGIELRNYDDLNLACSFRGVIWLQKWDVNSGCVWDLSAVDWGTREVLTDVH